jgi:beta-lactamase regulating signal transducer with metallopeptidase domain
VRLVWSPTLEPGTGISTGPDRGPSLQVFAGRQPARTDRGGRIARWLALGWLLVVGLGCARLVLAGLALRRLVGRSTAPSLELRAALDELASQRGQRSPGLVVSEQVRSPVLVGLLRPTIVIPTSLASRASSPAMAHFLRHELAHADARDTWFTLAAALSRVLWYAVPTSWWLNRQLRLDREFVADQASLLQPGDSAYAYTRSLVELAAPGGEAASEPQIQHGLGLEPVRAPSALLDRALMLLQCPFAIEPSLPWPFRLMAWGCSAVLLLALCHLSLGSRL